MAGLTFADLELERLRFYLSGEKQLVAGLYETLFNQTLRVDLRPGDGPVDRPSIELAPEECLAQVGFDREDGLLPYPNQSFLGYRLLTEFFTFPQKFAFVDFCGLDRACRAGFGEKLEVFVFLRSTARNLEQGIDDGTFRLGCTPVINLFEQTSEPIPLTQKRFEYRIIPDVSSPEGMEVYSVDSVTGLDPTTRTTTEYHPFYSYHHSSSRGTRRAFWHTSRRPSLREGDRGSEVFLNLVDLNFDPRQPAESTLVVKTTCTNRDQPRRLQDAGDRLSFTLETVAPLAKIRCLRMPTTPQRPPTRRGAQWRLVSHLCLNHLSLTDEAEGRDALQEILRLYDFSDPDGPDAAITRQLIEGITSLTSRRVVGWNNSPAAGGFCRGVEVTVEFDEQKYLGTGVLLFASVLERFFGLYTTINSFSQLVGKTKQGGHFKTWAPREGEQKML
jgi:type VI secretion system protein ImpG